MSAAIIITVITALALALAHHYVHRGLFSGAVTLISLGLAAMATLAFGPAAADALGIASPQHYGGLLGVLGLVSFIVVRSLLGPLDLDVDFHLVVERIGGALSGLACGLVVGGFVAVCLSCARLEPLPDMSDHLVKASDLVLLPAQTIRRLMPGRYPLTLQTLIERAPPATPAPPAEPPSIGPRLDEHTPAG